MNRLHWLVWVLLLTCLVLAYAYTQSIAEPDSRAPAAPAQSEPPESVHALAVFGGKLLGSDRGEWIGELIFRDEEGISHLLIKENVMGIVRNEAGIFVFTGLAHLSINEGNLYSISRGDEGQIIARLLQKLPGAPSQVNSHPTGTTTFLIFIREGNGSSAFHCYSLTGSKVARSDGCNL